MKKLILISSALVMLIFFASAGVKKIVYNQTEVTVTGVVSDATGPIPGANVVEKGTTKGVQTDMSGQYSIKTRKGATLVFSFVGMEDEQVKVGDKTVINVTLKEGLQLNEVVVGAMGTRRVKDATTSAQQIVKSYDMAAPTVGKVSGVQIQADQSQHIVLRGNRAISGETVKIIHNGNGIPVNINDEDYGSFIENAFETPKTAPLSTFSIDVDNASYTNIRRFINNGQKVPKDAVRVEEMMNFFKYAYPQPKSDHPFSINTDYADCPWNNKHKVVRIGLQGKNIATDKLPASNLVFLIDVSGSMNQTNKLPLLVESMKILVKELRPVDKVSMVVYAGAAGLVLPPTSGNDKQTIIEALDKLSAGGSTAGGAGIELAYKTAQENFIKGGNNRVILATDGDFNVGASSNNDMEKLIEEKRKSGVFLTVLGYGMGNYKDSKMEILADKGNGNYAYIDNIQEANRFLGKEFKGSMFAIAKDVKIQIEFNPSEVNAYRLIGYENRKLRPEDFTNDQIDAGELGSGHTVTALYEVIPAGVDSKFYNTPTDLKYTETKTKTQFSNELATVKFRYKKPDGDKSIEIVHTIGNAATTLEKAVADFKFASSVAWFGLRLRESKLIPESSIEDIRKLAKSGISNDHDGYKAEFVRLVESANLTGYAKN